jgi:hypothetical protein
VGNVPPHSDDPITLASQEGADIGHWQGTLARHIWFLRRAGIASAQIEREVSRSLEECLGLRKLQVPGSDERMYARILTHWRHESGYLDTKGRPLALRFEGHSPTFRSLIHAAVPGADASKALAALKSYHLVSHNTHGIIRLLTDGLLSHSVQRGPLLSRTHAALEALTDTCYANLHARRPPIGVSRIPQIACTDYLDRHHLRTYEEFLNESVRAFLAMHEAWLKRHEVTNFDSRRKIFTRVGVGVFAIRGADR